MKLFTLPRAIGFVVGFAGTMLFERVPVVGRWLATIRALGLPYEIALAGLAGVASYYAKGKLRGSLEGLAVGAGLAGLTKSGFNIFAPAQSAPQLPAGPQAKGLGELPALPPPAPAAPTPSSWADAVGRAI